MWPFNRKIPELLNPVELRNRLIAAAATGSASKLRSTCQQYKNQVGEHLDVITKVPEGMPIDDGSVDRHVQCLIAVAQCLAKECGSPELFNKMSGTTDDNPLVQWDRWFGELPARMQRLDYDALISEAKTFIERARTLKGSAARQFETYLVGRLGELLFHSGRVSEALGPFQAALDLCLVNKDVEGQITYLNNLLEAHCYLDDGQAVSTAEQLCNTKQKYGKKADDVEKRLKRLRCGEPLCRIVCVRAGQELELEEITHVGQGSYQFQFRRNRLSLQKASTLTEQGNQLASTGNHSDALGKYHDASEVDPFDPDPVYQGGMCLLELGLYAKAREAFEDVENLAPGWFRCRSDRWLADGLDNGTISQEEFMLLRVLDDGGLSHAKATALATEAVERFPTFAPLYLFAGDLRSNEKEAIAAYHKGLELVGEPDLESRLLSALAGRLPVEAPERKRLVERAVSLKGSLVAVATAKLMGLQ